MSIDNETLPLGNDLSKHLISQGYVDFETYNNSMPHGNIRNNKLQSPLVLRKNLNSKQIETTMISPHDLHKLICLRNSKLLLPADFELVEFLISTTESAKNYSTQVLSGSIFASAISLILYHCKRISFHLPVALISTFSFLSLRYLYYYFYRKFENRSFSSAVVSLQSLCLNVNKLLRLLKETEILSTGQVTPNNVGAALYIPVKSLSEQGSLPSWKTLPQLRICLASTLLDVTVLLKSTCSEARKIVPKWLYIKGFSLSNENSSSDIFEGNLINTNDFISLKDLQILNDSYLVLQSEFLRWLGFCLCPSVWNGSDSQYEISRAQILNLFFKVHSKLSVMSFKLKMQHDMQQIFTSSDKFTGEKFLASNKIKMNNVQTEVHQLYLSILSMLIHLKSLEDQLESNLNEVDSLGFCSLKETTNKELKNIRDELTSAVNKFDTFSLQFLTNKNSTHNKQCNKPGRGILENNSESLKNSTEERSTVEAYLDSIDEVFLATTKLMQNEREKQRDDWEVESTPPIPSTLMAELSSTLKPIKENFKEREKAALKRAGLEDINNESDSDEDIAKKKSDINLSSATRSRQIKRKHKRNELETTNHEDLSNRNEDSKSDSSSLSNEDLANNPYSVNFVENKSIVQEDKNISVLSDKSIASMIAMKSQSWGLAEEEYYSDD